MDLHNLLELGTKPTTPHVRNKRVILFETAHQVTICNQIIDAINSGIDLGDLLEGCLLTLCVEHYYSSNREKFNSSPIAKYLRDAGYDFELIKLSDAEKLADLIPTEPHYTSLILALKTLDSSEPQKGRIGLFLSFCSLFLPKLVVGDRASIEKALRQVAVHQEQGIITYPSSWLTTGHMKVIFSVLRSSFVLKFVLIHQGVNLVTGHDAYDSIISNSVGQTRFSGLLIVKTVLEFILQKTENGVTLHPLVRTSKVKNEVISFKNALSNLARHGEYAPFARVLNLSGINNLEHGLYPQLSAIALGVATAHGSTLAGVNVGEQYQQLREAAHDAEVKLQRRHEQAEIQSIAVDDEERKILEQFHLQKSEITHSQTLTVLSQKREKLARLAAELEANQNQSENQRNGAGVVSNMSLSDQTPIQVTVTQPRVVAPVILPPPEDSDSGNDSSTTATSTDSFVDLNDPFALLNDADDEPTEEPMVPIRSRPVLKDENELRKPEGQDQFRKLPRHIQSDLPHGQNDLAHQRSNLSPISEGEIESVSSQDESEDEDSTELGNSGISLPPPPAYIQSGKAKQENNINVDLNDPFGTVGDIEGEIMTPETIQLKPTAPPAEQDESQVLQLSPNVFDEDDEQTEWPKKITTSKGRTLLYPNDLLQINPPQQLIDVLITEYQNPISAEELKSDWPDMTFEERKQVAFNL
nr:nucleocapsid protein [Dehong virus]